MKLSLRIFASLMALLLVMGLAACGGTEDPQSSAAPGSSETSEPVSAPDESDVVSDPSEGDETTTATNGDETTTATEGEVTTTKGDKTTATKGDKTTATKGDKTTTTKVDKTTTTKGKETTKTRVVTTVTSNKVTTTTQKKTSLTWDQVKKNIPASAKGKTLKVYDWNKASEVAGMAEVNSGFKTETGIKIDYVVINYDNYFTRITAEVAAKNPPDAVRVQNVSRQNLAYLQPFNNTGYNFNDTYWDSNVMEKYTFNGNIYAVNMVNSPYFCPGVVVYNKNLIEEYDLDDPYELWKDGKWTWDALWDMCKEFVKEGPDGASGLTSMDFEEYPMAHGLRMVEYDKKTNTFTNNLLNQTWIKSWQTYADYSDKNYVNNQHSNNAAFNNGLILFNFTMGIATREGGIMSFFPKLYKQGALDCVPFPALKKGAKDYQIYGEVQAMGIPKGAKNADLVPYYARYYYDVNNYNMDKFYALKHAAEVTKYIQNSDPVNRYNVMTQETTNYAHNQFTMDLQLSGSQNVIKSCTSMKPVLDAALEEFSSFLASL